MTPKEAIEPLKIISVPMRWEDRDCFAMWEKINEIVEYINNVTDAEKEVLDVRLKQDLNEFKQD